MQYSRSTLVCPCHDVTEDDIDVAVRAGHTSAETIKRATAVYMGGCQGKFCAPVIQRLLREKGVVREGTDRRPAARLPIVSLPLGCFIDGAVSETADGAEG